MIKKVVSFNRLFDLVILICLSLFPENLTTVFGERLKTQVEDRLKFYENGDLPKKNVEVMSEALQEHNAKLSQMGAQKRPHEENGKRKEAKFRRKYILDIPLQFR